MVICMTIVPDLSAKTITLTGALLATGAAIFSETTSDATVGAGSFLLGGAGLIAAISAFAKDFWSDRQKQREHEIAKLRIELRNCKTCNALLELYNWARAARRAVPGLPPVPAVSLHDDPENLVEKTDA
jgi:hypothetical protein